MGGMRVVVATAMALGLCLTGCSSTDPPTVGAGAPISKVLVFVVENHSLNQMRQGMPYTFSLAEKYGYASAYRSIQHPSLPNYLAIAGGSTFGVQDDGPPAVNEVSGQSVFGQALALGKTARTYLEGMPGTCALDNTGKYVVRHNPWAYFRDERAACAEDDVPLDQLAGDVAAGTLPNAGMAIGDLCHDAHDCPLSAADDWLKTQLGMVLSGPDFTSGRLVVVVTADEDDRHQGNTVLTTVLHPDLDGVVVAEPLTHYALTGLYDEVLGAAPLRQAATAPSLLTAFGLAPPPSG
ncbi:Phosphoesterase [metagenome]|uniref:Phosphoesterase n=1 Tax=metagenome TaxID=256318 RepID=A0A2P2BZ17_9ZZZZ